MKSPEEIIIEMIESNTECVNMTIAFEPKEVVDIEDYIRTNVGYKNNGYILDDEFKDFIILQNTIIYKDKLYNITIYDTKTCGEVYLTITNFTPRRILTVAQKGGL